MSIAATSTELSPVAPPRNVVSLGHVKAEANLAIQCGWFKDVKDVAQAAIKKMMGSELGFGTFASLLGVYIVDGRPSFSANLIGAAIKRSGRYDYRVKKLTNDGCELTFLEKIDGKWETLGVSPFTADDAKKAGLLGRTNWAKFPRNMYFARALSNGARWFTPDIFAGTTVYTPEELDPSLEVEPESGEVKGFKPLPVSVLEAEVTTRPAVGSRLDALKKLIEDTGADATALKAHYKVRSLEDLATDDVEHAIGILETRRQAMEVAANA